MKAKARAALGDEQKASLYAKRKAGVESTFGNIKGNLSFTRFLLRGLEKVQTEFGIVAIAHNILKVAGIRLQNFSNTEKERIGKLKMFSLIRSFFGLFGQPLLYYRLETFYLNCSGILLLFPKKYKIACTILDEALPSP